MPQSKGGGKPPPKSAGDLQVRSFKDKHAWARWLERNHAASPGIWLRLSKKSAGLASVSYDEALEVALCYGWIDGQKKSDDESWWLQKFGPRGPKSMWSRVNREKASRLIANGQMKPAGLAAVESARRDGRWQAAYDSPSSAQVPEDFQAELDRNQEAKAFFGTLNSANRYAILWRLQTAKRPETRARRIREFITMLEKHEKLHP